MRVVHLWRCMEDENRGPSPDTSAPRTKERSKQTRSHDSEAVGREEDRPTEPRVGHTREHPHSLRCAEQFGPQTKEQEEKKNQELGSQP